MQNKLFQGRSEYKFIFDPNGEVNNLTFGAHFHGVELIMLHSIAEKTNN